MADPNQIPEELADLASQLPEGTDMEEFMANLTRMAMEFMKEQGSKPIESQIIIFFVCLLIPMSLLLFCFCKILKSQRKRQGKDKKKQKEQKKDTKKKV